MNFGYLTHHILDPRILAQYLEAVEDDLEETAPAFEPVFTNVYQYYSNSLIYFTNIIDDLLLQLLIIIKLKVQVPMSLFSIKTAPVPLDAETYCMILVPVIVLCLSAIFVHNINSSELHFQSVALRSQYSDHMQEVVTLH